MNIRYPIYEGVYRILTDIYADFIRYCHYKGKKIPSIERRRKEEYKLLFIQ